MENEIEIVQQVKSNAQLLVQTANSQMVTCQEEADKANEILQDITRGLKFMEEKRTAITGPINESLHKINEQFKQIIRPITEAKCGLSGRLIDWRNAERQRIDEERRKAEAEEERRRKIHEAHREAGHQVKEAITPVAKPVAFEVKDTTKTRKQWAYEITDEKLVPREYLIVNSVAINEAIRAGIRDIQGVRIYQKEIPIFG